MVKFVNSAFVSLLVPWLCVKLANKLGDTYNKVKPIFILLLGSLFSTVTFCTEVISDKVISNNQLTASASTPALTPPPVMTILNKMREAVLYSDYQIYFVLQDSTAYPAYPNTFKYTYLSSENKRLANLFYLEGSAKEIILQDNIVSYFQNDSTSFSISANHIIEAFPDVVYNHFDTLTEYYDFVLLGKARSAGRSSRLVRVIPKDKDRYHYVIWIDEESYLPLRIDLLDLDSKIISQSKILSLNLAFDKQQFTHYIEDRDYPILIPIDKENSELHRWEVSWLPKGFKESATYNINFNDASIDTRLFSDGVFSFTINVSQQSKDKSAYVSRQGARTVYSTNRNQMNIVIVGNLPVETIEKIAQSIKLK